MSAPVVPQRPARSQDPQPTTSTAPTDIPKIPPRPARHIARSASRDREAYARSPLNAPGFAFKSPPKDSSHGFSAGDQEQATQNAKPERPPSVAYLPLVGQEGIEYASMDQVPQLESTEAKLAASPTQTRIIASDLPLHAPKAAPSASAAQKQIAGVTRLDSTKAAAVGLGKPQTEYHEPEQRGQIRPPSASSNHMRPPSATDRRSSSTRPMSAYDSDHDHGIPEIGLRVGLNPSAGDVQAPTPYAAPVGSLIPGGPGSRPVTADGRRRSAQGFHGPPGSYGLHGHGMGPHDQFDRAWYQRHPEEAAKDEHGAHGHALAGERPEFALSSEELNKIVHSSGRLEQGIDRSSMGTPDEFSIYQASDELNSARQAEMNSQSGNKNRLSGSQGPYVESPLRNAAISGSVAARDDRTTETDVDKLKAPLRPEMKSEASHDSASDMEPHERGTTPILASDEVARRPADWRHAAVGPEFNKHAKDEDYYSGNESDASYRPKSSSRNRSRPNSVHDHHGLSRWTSHEAFEGTGTPLESVEEYEPLFKEDEREETKRPMTRADRLKRPELERHRFPSQDIWEDTPSSLQYTAEVDEPEEILPQAKPTVAFEHPDKEQARKGEITEPERLSFAKQPIPGVAKAKPKFSAGIQQEVLQRPGLKQRFPSQDIWEDSPDSLQYTAEIDDEPPAEQAAALPEQAAPETTPSAVPVAPAEKPGRPVVPSRPVRTKEAPPIAERKAPTIPERPKPTVPARPKAVLNDQAGASPPVVESSSTAPEVTKTKPAVVPRSEGVSSKFASIKAGFMNDLNSRLKIGPQAPPKPAPAAEEKEEEEKAPLADARKGRARGPARRKPAASPSADTASAATTSSSFTISVPRSVWSIGNTGSHALTLHELPQTDAMDKLKPVEDAPMGATDALTHVPDPQADARARAEEEQRKTSLEAHDLAAVGHPGDMPEPPTGDETHVSTTALSGGDASSGTVLPASSASEHKGVATESGTLAETIEDNKSAPTATVPEDDQEAFASQYKEASVQTGVQTIKESSPDASGKSETLTAIIGGDGAAAARKEEGDGNVVIKEE